MWRDSESDQDFLNFSEVAEQISTLLTTKGLLPISIGVYGGWGTGKSTILRLVEERLKGKSDMMIVKFDAWLYQGIDDARAAFLEVVSRDLFRLEKKSEALLAKLKKFAKRINVFRALTSLARAGLALETARLAGTSPALLIAGGAIAAGKITADEFKAAKEEATEVAKEVSEAIKDEEKSPPREIDELRKDFGDILAEVNRTLVVFIDNLDRCLPDAAIGTLEAMRLFLFMERTGFVVAADEEMVRRSVAKHFAGLDPAHVRDYLDKVIQVPLRVPQVGAEDLRAYTYSLFVASDAPSQLYKVQATLLAALQNSWKGQTFTKEEIAKQCGEPPTLLDHLAIADGLAPIFAKATAIQGNPRIVKRLLNAIVLRSQLATSRKMTINLATLAKLAVFERCTGEQATVALYRAAMAGDEAALKWILMPKEPLGDLPPEWSSLRDFLEEWRQMAPPIDSIEQLKAAAFLNRDALAPAPSRPGTSEAAEKAFQALRMVDSVNSKAGKDAVNQLSPDDRAAVMTRLIDEMRDEDWKEPVAGVHGAIILTKSSPQAFAQLKSFIETLPKGGINAAATFLFKSAGLVS